MADRYPQEFDTIRPYSEEELPSALQRLVQCPDFDVVSSFVYPDVNPDEVKKHILAINSIDKFQISVMYDGLKRIVNNTITNITWEGADVLSPGSPYLFVSNHRDIALDAFLLQYILHVNNLPTCQITFGANLMKHPLVIEVGRINKMFRVERGGSLLSFYTSMAKVSAYMRYCITERRESVWIAQRNGRTKNGKDATEPSLLKMFASSGDTKDLVANISQLNIVPVSVSYEWEPCDWMKARELSLTVGGVYHKSENEDLQSIITGIIQPKGDVHFGIGRVVSHEDLEKYDAERDGDFFKWLASLIDSRIFSGYKLMPNNYIAHDLRSGESRYGDKYDANQKERFLSHIEECCSKAGSEAVRPILLDIYANPVNTTN